MQALADELATLDKAYLDSVDEWSLAITFQDETSWVRRTGAPAGQHVPLAIHSRTVAATAPELRPLRTQQSERD